MSAGHCGRGSGCGGLDLATLVMFRCTHGIRRHERLGCQRQTAALTSAEQSRAHMPSHTCNSHLHALLHTWTTAHHMVACLSYAFRTSCAQTCQCPQWPRTQHTVHKLTAYVYPTGRAHAYPGTATCARRPDHSPAPDQLAMPSQRALRQRTATCRALGFKACCLQCALYPPGSTSSSMHEHVPCPPLPGRYMSAKSQKDAWKALRNATVMSTKNTNTHHPMKTGSFIFSVPPHEGYHRKHGVAAPGKRALALVRHAQV